MREKENEEGVSPSLAHQEIRRSIIASSGVWVGALAENKNDFGAFCTRKTDFSMTKLLK